MTCEDGGGCCQDCHDRAPGTAIIDGKEYEYYCQKFKFSPRRPFSPARPCVRCGEQIPANKPYLEKPGEGAVCWHCHREEIGLTREGGI